MSPSGVTAATRALLIDRSAGFCEVCGARAGSNAHHRLPRGMGGTKRNIHTVEWLLHVCGSGTTGCHGYIESHRGEAYDKRWLLRQGADPSQAVWLYGHVWVTLTPDGGYNPHWEKRWRTAVDTEPTSGASPEPLF